MVLGGQTFLSDIGTRNLPSVDGGSARPPAAARSKTVDARCCCATSARNTSATATACDLDPDFALREACAEHDKARQPITTAAIVISSFFILLSLSRSKYADAVRKALSC